MTKGLAYWSGTPPAPPPPPPNLDGYTADLFGVYGLYRLLTAYSGHAIKVRRSSDNATQDIDFLSGGGLDTASLATFVGSSSAYVDTWYDQSGAGNDLQQLTTTQQPQITNAGTYDGKVVFDGVDDVMTCVNNTGNTAGASAYMKGILRSTSVRQIFAQSDNGVGGTDAAHGSVMWDYEQAFHGYRCAIFSNVGANIVVNEATGASLSSNVNAIVGNFASSVNADRVPYFVNGTRQSPSISTGGTVPTTVVTSAAKWNLGAGTTAGATPAQISIIEFVIYAAAHSDATVAAISTILNSYS